MPYIGRSSNFAVRTVFTYTPSAGDTSVSGGDVDGKVLHFIDGRYAEVYLNGVKLKLGTDYNTNTADTIAGLTALAANDEIEVVVYDAFNVSDTVSATQGGAFAGVVTANAGVVVDNITIDGNDISTTNTNGNLTITPNGTGDLQVNSDRIKIRATEGETATLVLAADEDDDNGDTYKLVANLNGTFAIQNDISGSDDVTHVLITPNATVANSTAAFLGHVTVGHDLSIAGDLTVNGDTATFASANANDPDIIIKNTTNDTNGARLTFTKDKGAAGADGDDIGVISFISDNDAQQQTTFAKIIAEVSDASDGAEGGKLNFQVASHDGEMAPGLIINDGDAEDEVDVNIGFGTSSLTSVAGNIDVTGTAQIDGAITSNGNLTLSSASSPTLRITDTTNTSILDLRANDSDVLIRATSNHPMILNTNQVNRMTVETNGDVTVEDGNLVIGTGGHGIDFSAQTAGGGATSELLDHYEEGTWSPILASDATAGGYTTQVGTYTKIGNVINANFSVQMSSIGNFAGAVITITNLPFNSANNNCTEIGSVRIKDPASSFAGETFLRKLNNDATMRLELNSATTTSDHNTPANKIDTGTLLQGSIAYLTA